MKRNTESKNAPVSKAHSGRELAPKVTEGECGGPSKAKLKVTQAPSVTASRATFLSEEGLGLTSLSLTGIDEN